MHPTLSVASSSSRRRYNAVVELDNAYKHYGIYNRWRLVLRKFSLKAFSGEMSVIPQKISIIAIHVFQICPSGAPRVREEHGSQRRSWFETSQLWPRHCFRVQAQRQAQRHSGGAAGLHPPVSGVVRGVYYHGNYEILFGATETESRVC